MTNPTNISSLSRRNFLQNGGGLAAGLFMLSPTTLESSNAGIAPAVQEEVQYKWLGLEAIVMIEDGNVEAAIDHLEELLQQYHNDPEFLYGLAVAYTQQGAFERAADYVQRAVDAGLPFSRFQAGPRSLLGPLYETSHYQSLAAEYGQQLVHGPMVGSVTDSRAKFWVRTADEVAFQVEVYEQNGSTPIARSAVARTRRSRDYTAIAEVDGLPSDTRYEYRYILEDLEVDDTWHFRTFPAAGEPAAFDIGFAGCAGYTPKHERIWRTIAGHDFPAFLLTGDNVYIDQPEHPAAQQYCYYRRQSRPEFRAFTSSQSIFAIWDDHDFATDDSRGGPEIDTPEWKVPVWEIFRNNWNNPQYGGGEERPGCWFNFSIADVDFFMLDDRMYRTNPEQDSPSMLGPHQKEWLFEQLRASTGTFKFLITSVPWAYGTKPGSLDPWQGYKEERAEIFSFLHNHRIEGVILLSGDRHRADVWKIERPAGYDLYEFENAQLTNIHTHDTMPDALFSYNAKNMFGKLTIDTVASDPGVTYEIITIDDEPVHSTTVRLSDLSY
jgi:alkaline phosphatase D